jgi:hypothetical protein
MAAGNLLDLLARDRTGHGLGDLPPPLETISGSRPLWVESGHLIDGRNNAPE